MQLNVALLACDNARSKEIHHTSNCICGGRKTGTTRRIRLNRDANISSIENCNLSKSVLFCIFFGTKSLFFGGQYFCHQIILNWRDILKKFFKNMEHSSNLHVYLQTGHSEGCRLVCFDHSQPTIRSRFSILLETVMGDKV